MLASVIRSRGLERAGNWRALARILARTLGSDHEAEFWRGRCCEQIGANPYAQQLRYQWFQIAVAHERTAIEARQRAVAARDGSQKMGEAFDDELQATMVVVAATAFAIDALYVKVDELLDEPARSRAERLTGRIVETFKTAFALGRRGAEWQKSIPKLFAFRGELVHFRGEDHESQPHPTGKSHVSMESSAYTVERASWAVDLALEVRRGVAGQKAMPPLWQYFAQADKAGDSERCMWCHYVTSFAETPPPSCRSQTITITFATRAKATYSRVNPTGIACAAGVSANPAFETTREAGADPAGPRLAGGRALAAGEPAAALGLGRGVVELVVVVER
jgi:hypothetical protein